MLAGTAERASCIHGAGTVIACKSKKIGGDFVLLPPLLNDMLAVFDMKQWLLLLSLFMVAACRPGADDLDLVRRADALWQTDMDSAAALLARVERPELLPRRELLHYGL